ncbi:MAG: pyrroline-5-carboxylate reductase, partial [Calothrix sp. SM1_7_51]|nr:pyrroline-5-carboxylate reductase [Calothrix sp. SM1_7_51]
INPACPKTVKSSGLIWQTTAAKIIPEIEKMLAKDCTVFKIKIGRQSLREDIELFRQIIRLPLAPNSIVLDGNRCWEQEQLKQFVGQVDPNYILYFEEPLRDLGLYAKIDLLDSIRFAVDESFFEQKYSVLTTADNNEVFVQAQDVVFLAIKPQIFSAIAQELASVADEARVPLVISIMAGVSIYQLEAAFPRLPVIRAMPNTPATVGAGVTAVSGGAYIQPKHQETAREIFAAVGEVVEVSESLMDAVTGLSGSGPAYVALMVEALADGGVASGLPRPIAQQLALETVLGTAKLLKESKLHPAELKDRVTSPGGTTIAGIAQLEKNSFRSALIEAVKAATARSQELGK